MTGLPTADLHIQRVVFMTQSKASIPTILAVDNDTRILAFFRQLCLQEGFRLLMAFDGADALTLYLRHRSEISMVISDKTMPGMDGVLLWHALRKLDPDIRFLMLSGSVNDAEIRSFVAQGMVACLRKPCRLQPLLTAIHAALNCVEPAARNVPGS